LDDAANPFLTVGAPALERSSGKFYYEVKLGRDVVHPQIGWAADIFEGGDAQRGCCVGDNDHSWAADGQSRGSCNGGNVDATAWPESWSKDDVVGCAIDLDVGTLQFAENGRWVSSVGAKFPLGAGPYPAVSLQGECTFHFQAASFEFSPPDQSFAPLLNSEVSSFVLSRWSSHHMAFVDSSCCSCGSKVDVNESQKLHGAERTLRKTVQGWAGRYPLPREAEVVEELLAFIGTQHFLANDLYKELADFYSEQGEYELEIASLQKRCSFYTGAYQGLSASHAWAIEALADAQANHAVDVIMPTSNTEFVDLFRCAVCGYAKALGIWTLMYGSRCQFATAAQAKIDKVNGFLAKHSQIVNHI